jgi:hypothetical protein
MSEYSTKHIGLATFLIYVLGDAAHLATEAEHERSCRFHFDDPNRQCKALGDAFFSPEGAAIDDARALLECKNQIVNSTKAARHSPDGTWERNTNS